jgi:dihydropyrimidinase
MNRREFLERAAIGGVGIFGAALGARRSAARATEPGDRGAGSVAAGEGTRAAELVVRNGRVATAERLFEADIRVRDGKISQLGRNLPSGGADSTEIDASGCFVAPGGIDPHVHLTVPDIYTSNLGRWPEDFESGSRAALAGGITTLGNIAFPKPSEGLLELVEREGQVIRRQAIADVILHPVVGAPSWTALLLSLLGMIAVRDYAEVIDALPRLAAAGQTSIKIFMTFEDFDRNFDGYFAVVRAAREAGLLVMMHCEDASTLKEATRRLVAEGRDSLAYFAESRPVVAEEQATRRAVSMCEKTGTPIYVVHLSSERALRVCEEAQSRGLPVYVEARPLYLYLTQEKFKGPDGPLYVGQPPLREAKDVEALWQGLGRGSIHTLATDHVGWTREQKLDPSLSIEKHRPGVNNLQVMLPMLYSEGVRKQRITLERFVAVTSTNAAKIFGLYPRKGAVEVGSDADLVVWDPEVTRTIRGSDMLSRAGFSVYEGMEVTGWPRLTLRRGELTYHEGRVADLPGTGQLLRRRRWEPLSL